MRRAVRATASDGFCIGRQHALSFSQLLRIKMLKNQRQKFIVHFNAFGHEILLLVLKSRKRIIFVLDSAGFKKIGQNVENSVAKDYNSTDSAVFRQKVFHIINILHCGKLLLGCHKTPVIIGKLHFVTRAHLVVLLSFFSLYLKSVPDLLRNFYEF